MAYCGPHGIPYSTFCDWDSLSRDAAVAWALREADVCGGCGLHRSDLLDADGIELREQPYVAVPVKCPGCAARETAEKNMDARPGVTIGFVPVASPLLEALEGTLAE